MDVTTLTATWRDAALCLGSDVDFFPSEERYGKANWQGSPLVQAQLRAKAVCAQCPVAAECLDYAMAEPSLEGVWGGTIERERRRLRKGLTRRA